MIKSVFFFLFQRKEDKIFSGWKILAFNKMQVYLDENQSTPEFTKAYLFLACIIKLEGRARPVNETIIEIYLLPSRFVWNI